MMIATDDNVKRAFKQMHDAAQDMVDKKWVFGSSIAFMTTTFVLCRQLRDEQRLSANVETAQLKVIADAVSNQELVITQPDSTQNGLADPNRANLNHLRNAFSHGNWNYDPNQVSSGSMEIVLEDYFPNQTTPNWRATIELPDLINLAEKLLVETYKGMT